MKNTETFVNKIYEDYGVKLSPDDPIILSFLMNEKLISENTEQQEQLLNSFQEEFAVFLKEWKKEILQSSEDILNASLESAQNNFRILSKELTKEIRHEQQRNLNILQKSRLFCLLNITVACFYFFTELIKIIL